MLTNLRLIGAGIAMVGTSYGLARYGYGLLLPEMRDSFHVSNAVLGAIATGSSVAFLVGTAFVAAAGGRIPGWAMVALGGAAGVAGMLIVALAQTPAALALGVVVAGVFAALAYPPFTDAVAREVSAERRGRAMSFVSAGTGWGVALAVPIAIAVGSSWRIAWVAFTVVAAVATIAAVRVLRRGRAAQASGAPLPALSWSWFVCPRSGPLLFGALLVGTGASVYWTFAVDYVSSGGLPRSAGPLLLAVVGLSSVLGSLAGDVLRRLGGRRAVSTSALGLGASLLLLAAAPSTWACVIASAVAFGATYNILLAVQVIWSSYVFAARPSTGAAAVLFMLGIGQIGGPVIAGALADSLGMGAAFFIAGGTIALAALLPPREELRVATSAPVGAS